MPRVTIAIPVYNGARTIERTLRSALAQTFADLEILVCDNASTDGTRDLVLAIAGDDPRVRYRRNETNIGANRNWHLCLELARGDYLAWLGADDWIDPDFVAATARELDLDPDVVGCISDVELVDTAFKPIAVQRFARCRPATSSARANREVFFEYPSHHFMFICALHRRSVLMSIDLFPRTWRGIIGGAEHVILASLAAQGRLVAVPRVLMRYTIDVQSYWRRAEAGRTALDYAAHNALLASQMTRWALRAHAPARERARLAMRPWGFLKSYPVLVRDRLFGIRRPAAEPRWDVDLT